MSLIVIKDSISPDLRMRGQATSDKRSLLAAMGQAVKSLGIQAFTDAAKRPTQWMPRLDNYPHPLLQGHALPGGGSAPPMLRKSIRVTGLSNSVVTIGSDRPYAAIHQLGGKHIPARPYLPFYQDGRMTGLGRQRVDRALAAALRVRGL